ILNKLNSVVPHGTRNQVRPFFYWLTIIFNRVDEDRRKLVGPDLACAEWLLKNGAFVRWKDSSKELTDYNLLPSTRGDYYIEAVNANNAGITHVGFPYFEGCKHITEVKLESCKYISDQTIPFLSLLKDSLIDLKIIKCKSVTDEGLQGLKPLENLKTLQVQGISYLKDRKFIHEELLKILPDCKIDIQ
ncbi:ATP synthase subunit s, mitochondrial, partial [Dufourea novaeangliae]